MKIALLIPFAFLACTKSDASQKPANEAPPTKAVESAPPPPAASSVKAPTPKPADPAAQATELAKAFAAGKLEIAKQLDPATPFAYVDHSANPQTGRSQKIEKAICASDTTTWEALAETLRGEAYSVQVAFDVETISCREVDGLVRCHARPTDHQAPARTLMFSLASGAPKLVGIARYEVMELDDSKQLTNRKRSDDALAKLAKQPCK